MNRFYDHDFIMAIDFMDIQLSKHQYRQKAIVRYLDKKHGRYFINYADIMKDPVVSSSSKIDDKVNVKIDTKEEYRQLAILRYLDKKRRRCFKKKIICKARSVEAKRRNRDAYGRMANSSSVGWVPITNVQPLHDI
jgi:hypothetical protein